MRKSIKPASEKNTVLRSLAAASTLCLLVTGLPLPSAQATQETSAKTGIPATATTATTTTTTTTTTSAPAGGEVLALRSLAKADRLKHLDKTKLHRLDWRVTGSGCAACLGRIRRRIDKINGIYEVAVAIKPPFGVAVIYDSSKTNMDEILKAGIKDETIKIEFLGMQDTKIDAVPLLLIPIYNSLVRKSDGDGTTSSTPSTTTSPSLSTH